MKKLTLIAAFLLPFFSFSAQEKICDESDESIYNTICVEDSVIPDTFDGSDSRVIAINFHSGLITVQHKHPLWSRPYRYRREEISVTRGCLVAVGFCVGDRVVPDNSRGDARIIAINFHSGLITVQHSHHYWHKPYRYHSSQLSLMEKSTDYTDCQRYGDAHCP